MRKSVFLFLFLMSVAGIYTKAPACTNFIFTRGSTTDGSVMITYSADSHTLFGELYHWPASDWPAGSMFEVVEWDTGKPLGKIPQVKHTYNVIGNMNEHQVAIGETTFGGREELAEQPGAICDYGALIYVSLMRAKTAREAIRIMGELVANYGYASSGESFSVSDANEAWIVELIGKGKVEKGAVWVAMRIPDGYVSGHANHPRITQFPMNDPENCLYAPDVITFARKMGWFNGEDKEFSFSDTYAPVDFSGARACEARVWAMFNRVNSNMGMYQDYAMGHIVNGKYGYATNRMPLWIKPDKKISVQDVMNLMRDHYEGTKMDMNNDLGAGPFHCPYRWRPMTWKVDSVGYVHERATSTQQTGFVFVAQSRNWLPDPIGGIFWFGLDDTYTMVYSPMYCGMTRVPEAYRVGNGDLYHFSNTSAFWIFNMVSNWAYTKYDYMIKDIQPVQQELEKKYVEETTALIDKKAMELYKKDKASGIKYITDYSVKTGQSTVKRWQELFQYLFVKYMDGNVKKEKDGKFESNPYGVPVMPSQPGYPKWWLKEIVDDHGKVILQTGTSAH